MGLLDNGIFAGFSNKTGAVIGYRRNGKDIVTPIPHRKKAVLTNAHLNRQLRFALLPVFLSRLGPAVKVGFKQCKKGWTAMNAAIAYNYKNALLDNRIDFAQLKYSKGPLEAPFMPAVVADGNDGLIFSWRFYAASERAAFTDLATVVIYEPGSDRLILKVAAATRADLACRIAVPKGFTTAALHCYLSFVSANGRMVSINTYISYGNFK